MPMVLLVVFSVICYLSWGESVTCDFEEDFCGWHMLINNTRLTEEQVICVVNGAETFHRFEMIPCTYSFAHTFEEPWTRAEISGFSNIISAKRGNNVALVARSFSNVYQANDIFSEELVDSPLPRCLYYSFVVLGFGSLMISKSTNDRDPFQQSMLAIHGSSKKDTYMRRNGVLIRTSTKFKISLKAVSGGGEVIVVVDDLELIDGVCKVEECSSTEFNCKYDHHCISSNLLCNFIEDCPDGSDELDCENIFQSEKNTSLRKDLDIHFCQTNDTKHKLLENCFDSGIAIPESQLCPDVNACQHTSFKLFTVCPTSCTCHYLFFECTTAYVPKIARGVTVRNRNVTNDSFHLSVFPFLVNLNLSGCSFSFFQFDDDLKHIQTVDLSNNNIEWVQLPNTSNMNLRLLILSNNPLKNLPDALPRHVQNIIAQKTNLNIFLHDKGNQNIVSQTGGVKVDQVTLSIDLSGNKELTTLDLPPGAHFDYLIRSGVINISHCSLSKSLYWKKEGNIADFSFNNIESYEISQNIYLHTLYLNHNKLGKMIKFKLPSLNLLFIDLSYNIITDIKRENFRNIPNIEYLNLEGNHIQKLESSVFSDLKHLMVLYLSNNEIAYIQTGSFKGLSSLRDLYLHQNNFQVFASMFEGLERLLFLQAEFFTICCAKPPTVLEGNCLAPADVISSCDYLIDVQILRVFIWYMSLSAIFGNIIVLVYRFFFFKRKGSKSQSILTINLSIADFLMGVYLYTIAFTNLIFTGEYGIHDYEWRHSRICTFAGALATVSSEASACFIFLITLDRVLAVRGTFSKWKINEDMSKKLAILTWMISLIIATVPAIEGIFSESFYSKYGICISLPLSVDRKPGWEYSMTIFIFFNSLLFAAVLVGQVLIFLEVVKVGRKVKNVSQSKKRETDLAKTLLAVAISDILCWIPIGIIGIITLFGIQIPGQMNAWVIVVLLPINSALNPILYTLFINVRQKRSDSSSEVERLRHRMKDLEKENSEFRNKRTIQRHERYKPKQQ